MDSILFLHSRSVNIEQKILQHLQQTSNRYIEIFNVCNTNKVDNSTFLDMQVGIS